MTDLVQRNLNRIYTAQANYSDRVSAPAMPETKAFYQGYDATSGKNIVKTVTGSVYYCQSQSTGATAIGDGVSLEVGMTGTPQIDTMPR